MVSMLASTEGVVAYLRPSDSSTIDDIVEHAMVGLGQAREMLPRQPR